MGDFATAYSLVGGDKSGGKLTEGSAGGTKTRGIPAMVVEGGIEFDCLLQRARWR